MHPSKVLIVAATLVAATAMSVVPGEVAGAQSPSTAVLVPSSGATVSGTQVVLDAGASGGVTQVQFELTGGSLSDSVIATATLTYYGWIAEWNSTTVLDGTYTLQSVATEGGTSATSPGISIVLNNGAPSVSIVLPSSGAELNGSQWLDALASPGVTQVYFYAVPNTQGVCQTGRVGVYACPIGYATPTDYGWLINWDTAAVPTGNYNLVALANYPNNASSGPSSAVGVLVVNTMVVVPTNGSTVQGSQILDCVSPTPVSAVQFWLTGGTLTSPQLLGSATPTEYGWLYNWNTASVANGTYSLYCNVTLPTGATLTGGSISITVGN